MSNRKKLFLLFIVTGLSLMLYLLAGLLPSEYGLVLKFRLPKSYAIFFAASCIGLATIIFQTIVNNHIISPGLMGINTLYVLVFTFVIFALGSESIFVTNRNLAFFLSISLMCGVSIGLYQFLFVKTRGNILVILLSGTVLTTLLSSITATLQRLIDPNEFMALQNNLYATFNKSNDEILIVASVFALFVIGFLRSDLQMLDVIALGRNNAINLGINYDATVKKLMLGVTLLVSVATAVVGPITFLGLITANVSRQLFKTYKHKYIILGSVLFGGLFLFLGQTYVEHILNYNGNVTVFVNVAGGLYFMTLLLKKDR